MLNALLVEHGASGAMALALIVALAGALAIWVCVGAAVGLAVMRGGRLATRGARRVRPSRAAVLCGAVLWAVPPVAGGVLLFWPIEPPPAPAAQADVIDPLLADLLGPGPTTRPRVPPPSSTPSARRLLAVLPTGSPADGWRPIRPPAFLPADRLFEKINGRDASFQAHGVVGMAYGAWRHAADPGRVIDVEVYDMGAPGGAIAKYTEEKPPGAHDAAIGQEGYVVASSVFGRQGRWYVRIVSGAEDARDRDAALALARALRFGQPGDR